MSKHFPYDLQPIRIPPLWNVTHNTWFEVDPTPETMEWFNESMMLGIQSSDGQYFIDLTFTPENDPNGNFLPVFYKRDESKSKNALNAWIPIGGGPH